MPTMSLSFFFIFSGHLHSHRLLQAKVGDGRGNLQQRSETKVQKKTGAVEGRACRASVMTLARLISQQKVWTSELVFRSHFALVSITLLRNQY